MKLRMSYDDDDMCDYVSQYVEDMTLPTLVANRGKNVYIRSKNKAK